MRIPGSSSLFSALVIAAAAALPLISSGGDATAASPLRTLDDYKHFRVASIDLVGRAPTRDEIAQFEQPGFDLDKWTEQHLQGPAYAERLTRIYMDVLRLEPNLNFSSGPAQLYRQPITGPDGKTVEIFYRGGQRRAREATDTKFCLTQDETGLLVRPFAKEVGTPIKVTKAVLDKYTTLVKPWWLYKDYRSPAPKELYGETWANPDPQFKPVATLLKDDAGKAITEVRICKEEAQTADNGSIYVSGRTKPVPAATPAKAAPPGKKGMTTGGGLNGMGGPGSMGSLSMLGAPASASASASTSGAVDPKKPKGNKATKPPPPDKPFAQLHKGEPVACDTKTGLDNAVDCGCGIGLERCIPNDGVGNGSAFEYPNHAPLGPDEALDSSRQLAQRWFPYWWSRESVQFITDIFASDRDFREILTGKQTFVNGPLAQFYKAVQRGNCCGPEAQFGMRSETEPLFDPAKVPADLAPQETSKWEFVPDRGQHAAGLLTQPMFLEKFASARARGAAVYNAFLCKSFNAENAELKPSNEANLMKRPGCQACHATLEPLAAYFARVEAANFVYLPEASFPVVSTRCKPDKNGHLNGACNALYDVQFLNPAQGNAATLRSAYGSPQHADEAPEGAAKDITALPDFAGCAVQRVASSFLDRTLDPDDATEVAAWTKDFVASGYRMKTLVRDIVRSNEYRRSNDRAASASPAPTATGATR